MIDAPFKCVGGKARMVPRLRALVPSEFVGYCEPFLGGGALFRALARAGVLADKPVRLSDRSPGTIQAWSDIQRNADLVTRKLLAYETEYNAWSGDAARERHYYAERVVWNSGAMTGPRHIFLRKLAFNGLWRVNKKGQFNVPWGRYKRFMAPSVVSLARVLTDNVQIECFDYGNAFQVLQPGWVVYVDPPYIDEFSLYTPSGFSIGDHAQLLYRCAEAKSTGVHVIYSNRYSADTVEFVKDHWPGANIERAVQHQTVAARNSSRGVVEEMIAT